MRSIESALRRRGGRGPQIGDHTFEMRSSVDDMRPAQLMGIAWSPGPNFPGVELWCFRRVTGSAAPPNWVTVAPPSLTSDPHSLWLDAIEELAGFVPPSLDVVDIQTSEALKSYARARLLSSGGPLLANTDWAVRVARPFSAVANATEVLKVGQTASEPLYEIMQQEATSSTTPVSWVWVRARGAREVWVHHVPGQAGGFLVPGEIPDGAAEPLDSTQLRFTLLDANYTNNGQGYANQLEQLKEHILADGHGEVASEDDLEIHDYRVQVMP